MKNTGFTEGPNSGPKPVYKRRKPETTVLYRVLQEHLETFFAMVEGEAGHMNWPEFVKRELKAYLDCGVLAKGFCRLHCYHCGRDEIVAFSACRRGDLPAAVGKRPQFESAFPCPRFGRGLHPHFSGRGSRVSGRYTFAELMKRVFNITILICPACKSTRELIAMIIESKVIRAILECLGLPPEPPLIQPARWLP